MVQRLPIVNSDDGTWGTLLVSFLKKEHYDTGADNALNGGHQNITIKASDGTAGTAPITFNSGTNLTTPVAGAMEYDGTYFYLTQGSTRKKIAIYDDSGGATGDIYYRASGGAFTKLGIGTSNQQLTVSFGNPAWKDTAYPSNTVTAAVYTIATTDTVVFADATSNNVSITLPSAASYGNYRFYIKRIDSSSNIVSVVRSGSNTIDGQTSLTLDLQYTALLVVSNGTNWYIL